MRISKPPYRKLKGYAFDPLTSLDMDTAEVNQIVYKVPWEGLSPGPTGEYIEVIDRDPASDAVYEPVDLENAAIIGSDGLNPSETNPQFHQQMVYAVIMITIRNFEKALGRKVIWNPVQKYDRGQKKLYNEYVPRLLVYPHAIREQNAYYSPERRALLFGYYNATPVKGGSFLPGGIVYSCLSHDIIAHETTHALLDSVYSRFMEITHPDIAGFHEGFSDIVALLQHFTYPEIVRNQIRKVRGQLDTENLLGKLAVEFGQSTGEYSSLRDAIGSNVDGKWVQYTPSTQDYETQLECHDRGALLVAAIFDAFHAIYKRRTADLVRLATGGSGIVPDGEIHPDLVNRLADEASKTASHVLNMCIRALDYCPPVDLNYGDYLRALITADKELVDHDEHNYRIAFINAFRKRGIFPEGVPNLSVDTLCYNLEDNANDKNLLSKSLFEFLRKFKDNLAYKTDRREIYLDTIDFIRGSRDLKVKGLYEYLFDPKRGGILVDSVLFENVTGLVFSNQYKDLGVGTSVAYGKGPSIEIQAVRLNNRVGPDGNAQNQIIITLCQRTKVTAFDKGDGKQRFEPYKKNSAHDARPQMTFRAGCTLIFDLDDLILKHAIKKPLFDACPLISNRKLQLNQSRMQMQYDSQQGDLAEKIGVKGGGQDGAELFAALHQTQNLEL